MEGYNDAADKVSIHRILANESLTDLEESSDIYFDESSYEQDINNNITLSKRRILIVDDEPYNILGMQ